MQPKSRNGNNEKIRLTNKRRLQDLAAKVDPLERLDPDAEDILLELADEFLESVLHTACRFAKHRKSSVLEVKDVQLHLERNWNIRIPGFSSEDIRSVRRGAVSSQFTSKLAAVANAKSNKPKDQGANIEQPVNSNTAITGDRTTPQPQTQPQISNSTIPNATPSPRPSTTPNPNPNPNPNSSSNSNPNPNTDTNTIS